MSERVAGSTGGQLLVECLRLHGVDMAFGVPGESYLPVIDALHAHRNAIRFVVCRQEGGAANMAEAYGKLTGRPGVCLVTRGPGATNAAIGVHTAFQDSTPMILLIGQVGRDFMEREAFQEVDYRRMFGPLAKWVAQIDEAARIPEFMHRAFRTATSGRPGPVVLALPEDMLRDMVADADLGRPYEPVQPAAAPDAMAEVRGRLAAAERPLLIVGGGGWSAAACADVAAFAAVNALPVAASFRCQDYIDNEHPSYAGALGTSVDPALARRVREADLLLVVGARLGEMTTNGYALVEAPRPRQTLVHVHPSADELGRVYQPDLAINAGSAAFLAAARAMAPVDGPAWRAWTEAAHADFRRSLEPQGQPGAMDLAAVVGTLKRRLPDAIITTGAGNYTGWFQRYWTFRDWRTQLAPTSGAMGYGVPAAVAAKLACPDRPVISANGDGCFLMCGQELATAVQYGSPVLFLVVNNGMYGTIRMHQERDHPGHVYGTSLRNPDFAMLARAHGLHGERVERTEDVAAALDRALASPTGALLELIVDPDGITTRTTLSAITGAARSA